jgi:hypothetical protein
MVDTATDTLARKDKSGASISGGHLVAKGLKNEGVDTITTSPARACFKSATMPSKFTPCVCGS